MLFLRQFYLRKTIRKFLNTIDPFFKGIIVCDKTNNTAEVIQNNQFIADIDNIRLTVTAK